MGWDDVIIGFLLVIGTMWMFGVFDDLNISSDASSFNLNMSGKLVSVSLTSKEKLCHDKCNEYDKKSTMELREGNRCICVLKNGKESNFGEIK